MAKMTLKPLNLGGGLTWREGSAANGADFWALLGPLATDVAVHKELGEPIVSTVNHRWVFGIDNSTGAVVAAGALIVPHDGKDVAWLAYSYVAKTHRLRGLWKAMAAHRISAATESGAKTIKVVTRNLSRPLTEEGFTLSSQRGSWSYMEKAL
jgi:hypothetical protein